MTTATLPSQSQPSLLKKNLLPGITVATILVIAIMGLSFALHMINIDTIGDANAYYTAAVKSMLVSWKNFFFVAAEPGGSVTVDKPPLGLWIEAVFAYFLGVSGFSVSLPNILAGVFGIPVLYYLVKKYMGEMAGLIAALVMALTPVFVATNRNNTMDGMLVFFLLLAAWAFVQATETGKRRWLLLGAFIVGLGFNIKMMQAFLPLPAFYALYFFGSKEGWLRKAINLGIATVLLLVVSLSWAVAVDLTPADSRPYIGSSSNNTVMELIFGHNGLSRLESTGGPGGGGPQGENAPLSAPQDGQANNQGTQPQQGQRNGPPQEALDACASSSQGASCSFSLPNGNTINGSCITPPNLNQLACAPANMIPAGQQGQDGQAFNGQPPAGGPNGGQGGTQFSQETGEPGVLRFFTQPLSKQMSWLLPFALIAGALALFGARLKLPVEAGVHKAMLIWGGWLLTCVVFFSMVSGIFHAYYAIMLAPALGAVVGIGFAQLWDWGMENKKWAGVALIVISLVTIGFQLFATYQYGEKTLWMIASGLLFGLGVVLMGFQRKLAYITLFAAMLIIPAYWTMMTTASNANQNLPTAYSGSNAQNGRDGVGQNRPADGGGQPGSNVSSELVSYLESNTQGMEYLVAVPSSQQGSTIVLATGRPVLFMGGFSGQDDVVSAEDLAAMVANGELKYVLYGDNRGNKQDVSIWLQSSCTVIPEFSSKSNANGQNQPQGPGGGGPNQSTTLYQCD